MVKADKERQNFITYWIAKFMEPREECEAKTFNHMLEVQKGADDLKKKWAQPLMRAKFWQKDFATDHTKERKAEAKVVPLSPFLRILKDLDAIANADNSKKEDS